MLRDVDVIPPGGSGNRCSAQLVVHRDEHFHVLCCCPFAVSFETRVWAELRWTAHALRVFLGLGEHVVSSVGAVFNIRPLAGLWISSSR